MNTFIDDVYVDDNLVIVIQSEDEWDIIFKELVRVHGPDSWDGFDNLTRENGLPLYVNIPDDAYWDQTDYKDGDLEGYIFMPLENVLLKPILPNKQLWRLK